MIGFRIIAGAKMNKCFSQPRRGGILVEYIIDN